MAFGGTGIGVALKSDYCDIVWRRELYGVGGEAV